jgi:hypothetical protein
MNKIRWCSLQKEGIKLIEPNETIGKKYLADADSDMKDMQAASVKWKNIVSYYACYNAFYGILQKIGIKCEIHECTLELIKFLDQFSEKQKKLLESLKQTRIDVQYYLKPPKLIDEKIISDFILTCKDIFNKLSYDKIYSIRGEIQKLINNSTIK